MRRGHVPDGESIFEGLHVLPPGSWLRFDGTSVGVTRSFGWGFKNNFSLSMNVGSAKYSTFDYLNDANPVAVTKRITIMNTGWVPSQRSTR